MENETAQDHLELLGNKWEITTNQSEVGVGSFVIAKFQDDGFGRPISKEGMRKHLVVDRTSDQPEIGREYIVRVDKDTKPGIRGGLLIGELVDEAPSTKVESAISNKLGIKTIEKYGTARLPNDGPGSQEEAIKAHIKGYEELLGGHFIALKCIFNDAGQPEKTGITLYKIDDESPQPEKNIVDLSDIGFRIAENSTIPTKETESDIPEGAAFNRLSPIAKLDDKTIVFLQTEVEMRASTGPLVPSSERFRNFTLDENTVNTILHVASAYERRSPLFLEGDTATSKTSSVEFFASQIGAEVRRLNLSGQTDTSELIGKFVPNDGSIKIAFEKHVKGWNNSDQGEWEATQKKFRSETVRTMQAARDEGRILSKDELSAIALNEGFHITETQWVWQDGILPQAMKKGQILILDEVTLAEPQILERINSALENPASIVLTENGGVKIGPGGEFEIADGFWIVATGNPAGYAGRSILSDAFIRRFPDYYRVPNPTQLQFKQMLELMVYGTQPDLNINGVKYAGSRSTNAEFGSLSEKPEIKEFITHLAAFHMDIVKMSDPKTRTIGAERHRTGGKYVFTRDTLVAVLNFINKERVLDRTATARTGEKVYVTDFRTLAKMAIERFYLSPVAEADRQSVRDAMNKYSNRWLS